MPFLSQAALFLLLTLVLFIAGSRFRLADAGRLESTLIGVIGVLGAFALATWLLGMMGVIVSIWPLLAMALLLAVDSQRRGMVQDLARGLRQSWRGCDVIERALIVYLAMMSALAFVLTLAPPSGLDYDSLVYHLAAPRQYLRGGRIVELPYDHHTYFPFLFEMLYLSALKTFPSDILAGAVFAKLFHWLMLPISCAALVAIGQRHLSRRDGLLAASLFASIPFVSSAATTAYIDVGLTAIVLLQFAGFANWLQTRHAAWLICSGALGGLAMGSKYLGALFCLWLGVWLIVDMMRRRRFEIANVARFALPSLLIGGAWYLRNIIWTGNPVFPFAFGLFGGEGWTSQMARDYSADQLKFGFGRSPLDFLLLPWRVSMSPLNALLVTPQGVGLQPQPLWPLLPTPLQNGQSGLFETTGMALSTVLGPLLLAFGAPLIVRRHKPPVVGFFIGSFVAFGLFWFATGQYLRYAMPALALLCVACGWMVARCWERSPVLKWTSGALLMAGLLFAPLFFWMGNQSTLKVVSGAQSSGNWLQSSFSGYAAMQWANLNTPRESRFAVWGESRGFYLDRDYFWADDNHNNLIDYARVTTPDQLAAELKRLGATHILWNTRADFNGGGFGAPPILQKAFESGALELLAEERGYRICRVR